MYEDFDVYETGPISVPPARDGGDRPIIAIYGPLGRSCERFGEVVGLIVPEYDDVEDRIEDSPDAIALRIEAAMRFADQLQIAYAAEATPEVVAALTDAEGEAIFSDAPGQRPYIGLVWSSTLPLVLLDVDYQPYTPIPAPTTAGDGRVVYICPSSEQAFVESLAALGMIRLFKPAQA